MNITIQQLAFRIASRINANPRPDREYGILDEMAPMPSVIYKEFIGEFPLATYKDEVEFKKEFNRMIAQ